MIPTGGRWGTIPRLQEQLRRLFTCQIVCTFDTNAASGGSSFGVASEYELWWNPKKPEYGSLWNSTVTLGENFYEDIIRRPVPVDVHTLRRLKRSPLALDVYTWLTYRYSYLERETLIPWEGIQAQFGADYKELYNFRYKMKAALTKVHATYPEARFITEESGLRLLPVGSENSSTPLNRTFGAPG